MAFKMKRPMIMGTRTYKSALKHIISMREADKHDHPHKADDTKNVDDTKKAPNVYDEAKKKDPKLDTYISTRKDPNASDMEKAKAQDAINAAYGRGPTDRAEKLKAKQDAQPKKDSSKPAEKADTSKGSTADKIAKGDTSGAEKASGRMKPGDKGYMKLPESEKLKIQRAAKVKHKKALEAWRSGGKKGKRPQRKDYF